MRGFLTVPLVQNHNKGRWWALRPRPAYTFQRCNRLSRCRLTVRCSLVWRGQCVTFRAICGQLEGQKIGTFPAEITGKPPFVQTGTDFVPAIPQIPQKVTKTEFLGVPFPCSPLLPLTLSASALSPYLVHLWRRSASFPPLPLSPAASPHIIPDSA